MENFSAKKAILAVLMIISNFTLTKCLSQNLNKVSLNDTDLVKKLFNLKFQTFKNSIVIDSDYIKFKIFMEPDYCIAASSEKFSTTDNLDSGFCFNRLVFAGSSGGKNNIVQFVVYEDGRISPAIIKCDIFEIINSKLISFLSLYLPKWAGSLNKCRQAIRQKKFTIVQ